MLCERCGENEATIHEVLIDISGSKVATNLCEACAAQQMVASAKPVSPKARLAQLVCRTCGTTFAKFRKTGLLGCPACYEAFGDPLDKLLERAHEGAVCHVGKSPRRRGSGGRIELEPPGAAGNPTERAAVQAQIAVLRRQLDAAVRGECYERAAALHKEIATLAERLGGSEGDPN